jgi:hypothetical protein
MPRYESVHSLEPSRQTSICCIELVARNLGLKKTFMDLHRPTLHASGTIIHGLAELIHLTDSDIKKDPNTEMELCTDAISYMFEAADREGVDPPRHIFVQADNCAREMKNQFTLLWGVFLIYFGIVDSITFSYLRVGHTHEDIGNS